jgi:hypothetical protein
MGIGLPNNFFKKIIFFFALLLCGALQGVYAQQGSLAFTGFSADSPGDGFSVVTFFDIPEGTEVHFSSKEWDGSSFTGPGGDFTWIAPTGGVSEGTVLSFNDVEGNPSVNVGSIANDANMNLSGSGDIIYAYLGADKSTPDTPFMGAIATDVDLYNQVNGNEGTLANTGLTKDTTAILLPDNIDNAEYTGERSGNTANGYLALLNDIGSAEAKDDNWDIYNGTDDAPFPPFNLQSFIIVKAPTVAFTVASIDSSEDSGTATLTIELVESTGTEVKADVIFNEEASSASSSDIGSFASTVTFSGLEGNGETEQIDIPLNNDSDFEGIEKAIFQLKNIRESLVIGGDSPGTAISPNTLTLNISDDDAPNIVINEILYDPSGSGDANGDGTEDGTEDEFVELVNDENFDIDVSNWTISDGLNGGTVRYTFPEGTVIPSKKAIVVFSDSAEGANFGGANLYAANGTLSFNNGGDDVIIKDAEGNEITSVTYSGSASNESITRLPAITGSFVGHASADGDDSSPFSPGTKIDGTAFGSKYAIGIRGTEGWRMISSPVQNATFNDFFGDFWMQGIPGSDDPGGSGTLYTWTESGGGSFNAPSGMSSNLTPGQGYIIYVFEDDEFSTPGIQGGFPKVVNTNGTENGSTVSVTVSANDSGGSNGIDGNEGWNLLGNPFATDLSVGSLISALEDVDPAVNANIYVWDHEANSGNGEYIVLSDGDRIAPFQAFFVRFTNEVNDGTVTFDKTQLEANTGAQFYKNDAEDSFAFDLELHGEEYFDSYSLEFSENGTIELDRYDAYKLFSLNANSINLFSMHGDNRLQKNMLPKDLESNLKIPLSFDANGRTNLTFRWGNIDGLPNDWDVMLIDKEENREIDLQVAEEYQFTVSSGVNEQASNEGKLLNKRKGSEESSRFVLSLIPNLDTSSGRDVPESVKLNPNYPNPFNPTTTIPYEIAEDAEVKLTVWNMIGQKVATLVDGMVEAGTHQETWNANNMPSGIYIARFEVGNEVFTRKMTLIK